MLPKYIHRYTTYQYAKDILSNLSLTLVNPQSWQDGNDKAFLEAYRQRLGKGTLRVLCFTAGHEAHHYWDFHARQTHAQQTRETRKADPTDLAIVRLTFIREKLEKDLGEADVKIRRVRYVRATDIDTIKKLRITDLPYIKWYRYEDERELRVLWLSVKEHSPMWRKSVPIHRGSIERLTLGPHVDKELRERIENEIRGLSSDSWQLGVTKTNILNSRKFQEAVLSRFSVNPPKKSPK